VHEYSLVESLLRRVEEEARRRGALAIHKLTMRVGELSGVEAELLQTAYDTFRAGSICANAELVITRVPASWVCPQCKVPIARGGVLLCPTCDVPAQLDEGSDALTLDGIEMEVP
jgi:hydrogenase nickel incorporation protein HypA/HybF